MGASEEALPAVSSDWKEAAQSKLSTLSRYLGELEERLPREEKAYLADRNTQLAIERLCQLAIESAIDLNSLVICGLGDPPPQSAREGFETMERKKILPPELSKSFRSTLVGFRHRLVHDYEQVDNSIVHHTADILLQGGRRYIAALVTFLAD